MAQHKWTAWTILLSPAPSCWFHTLAEITYTDEKAERWAWTNTMLCNKKKKKKRSLREPAWEDLSLSIWPQFRFFVAALLCSRTGTEVVTCGKKKNQKPGKSDLHSLCGVKVKWVFFFFLFSHILARHSSALTAAFQSHCQCESVTVAAGRQADNGVFLFFFLQ